ncbi:MAG: hypothetical protein GXN99_01480 [Candidatus Nanohaloarchaeota archaeon]|nr:hypothetical protein [Candidatus Nanohaloarchaeota archaeon]
MSSYKKKIGGSLIKVILLAVIGLLTKKIKKYVIKLSIGIMFLIFGTYYLIDGTIRVLAENLGINLEHLRIITGIALLIGSYIVLKSAK